MRGRFRLVDAALIIRIVYHYYPANERLVITQ